MNLSEMVDGIKRDLGSDINSLGISDETIEMKIKEALRKISAYAPYQEMDTFPLVGNKVLLPEDTAVVINVMNLTPVASSNGVTDNDQDLFSYSRYILNRRDELSDPYIYLLQKNDIDNLSGFVNLDDWYYVRRDHTLYFNNPPSSNVTVKYLRAYRKLEEVTEELVIQKVKEYALALCKIIEGTIRRKLQSAPGAISMDGDSLVSEGTSERQTLDESLPRDFKYLRFGIRI